MVDEEEVHILEAELLERLGEGLARACNQCQSKGQQYNELDRIPLPSMPDHLVVTQIESLPEGACSDVSNDEELSRLLVRWSHRSRPESRIAWPAWTSLLYGVQQLSARTVFKGSYERNGPTRSSERCRSARAVVASLARLN